MRIMEIDKSKCLICEVSCQKGLAFFKFPKDESRLQRWIKEIWPLLDILKIQPNSLKENGRICARHFRERDFINCKQNSLVCTACPSLRVSNINSNFQRESDLNEEEEMVSDDDQSNDENGSEKDIFQCGRCKSQFELLAEFLNHKKFRCQPTKEKSTKTTTEKTESTLQYNALPVENPFMDDFENELDESMDQRTNSSSSEDVVKIINDESSPDSKIVSLIMNENSLVVGNPVDLSAVPTQMVITPELPLYYNGMVISNSIDLLLHSQVIVTPSTPVDNHPPLLNNMDNESQVSNLIITADVTNSPTGGIVYTGPMQNNNNNNNNSYNNNNSNNNNINKVIINSKVPANHVLLTAEAPSPRECVKDVNSTLSYSKLMNVIDETQNTSFNLQSREKRDKAERTNQMEESEFEKQKTKLPCSYCGKIFEKPFNLQQHERVHTGERPFQCIICGRAFSQKSNVRKHMMRHKVWPKGKQTLKLSGPQEKVDENGDLVDEIDYSCQYCTLSFKSYAEHKKHLVVHSNFKVYRCIQKDCNETFNDLDEFLSHSKMHSYAEFQCHICLKTFTSLEELGVHQYDHDTTGKEKKKETEIKLKCEICHARFKSTESLKNHLAVDTHKYECALCKSVFCSERFLRRHLFIHVDSSQSKFKCQNCKKSFRTQQNLRNHTFIHLKEKPFTCDHCDKQFASKYRLKRHVAIHLNQYLECPFKQHLGCDKTFYRKDKLRDHVNTHSHCRLRSCRVCSKMYWTLSKLHQHMKRDHKAGKDGKVLRCAACSQTFRKQKQLSQHHCTVEDKKPKSLRKISDGGEKENDTEAVANIEIIMVPFGANGENLT